MLDVRRRQNYPQSGGKTVVLWNRIHTNQYVSNSDPRQLHSYLANRRINRCSPGVSLLRRKVGGSACGVEHDFIILRRNIHGKRSCVCVENSSGFSDAVLLTDCLVDGYFAVKVREINHDKTASSGGRMRPLLAVLHG